MTANDGLYQIGEVAQESGFSVHTIRYYEKFGLLTKPERSEGGFRNYPASVIDQLRFVKKAQSFGLGLGEIKTIMQTRKKGLSQCCDHVNRVLNEKLTELEDKIKELQGMKRGLRSLLESWIPLDDKRIKNVAVCPQIEIERKPKNGGKRHGKKKS